MNTYLLTPYYRVFLEKLIDLQLVKKFPAFQGTRRFITALTSVRHLSLSWVSPIQSIYPHPTSWRSILILYNHLRLYLPSGILPSGFPSKTLYTPSPHPYAPHSQPISLFSILSILSVLGEEYKSFSSSLCNLLHFSVTSSLLGPKATNAYSPKMLLITRVNHTVNAYDFFPNFLPEFNLKLIFCVNILRCRQWFCRGTSTVVCESFRTSSSSFWARVVNSVLCLNVMYGKEFWVLMSIYI